MMNLHENTIGSRRRIHRSARRTCARGARGRRSGQYGYNDRDELISSRRAAENEEDYACQFSGSYNFFYTHDGNKNVSELVFFQQATMPGIRTKPNAELP